METASAFVPGHISGFFQPHLDPDDPLRTGSRNCGPCVGAGVLTRVEVEGGHSGVEVLVDGEGVDAPTTRTAVEGVLGSLGGEFSVVVEHSVRAPMGAGFGMSGAGALGAVMALVEVLDLDMDDDDVLTEAHRAEVTCGTGLGDVGPQWRGGLVIGIEPGAPPHGRWVGIGLEGDWRVVCCTLGRLSTSDLLDDSSFGRRAGDLGDIAMREFLSDRSVENFMRVSREFALGLDLYDDEFVEVLEEISSGSPMGASAVMLGRALFAPAPASEARGLEELFLDYFDPGRVMTTSVDRGGARLLG